MVIVVSVFCEEMWFVLIILVLVRDLDVKVEGGERF